MSKRKKDERNIYYGYAVVVCTRNVHSGTMSIAYVLSPSFHVRQKIFPSFCFWSMMHIFLTKKEHRPFAQYNGVTGWIRLVTAAILRMKTKFSIHFPVGFVGLYKLLIKGDGIHLNAPFVMLANVLCLSIQIVTVRPEKDLTQVEWYRLKCHQPIFNFSLIFFFRFFEILFSSLDF